MPRARIDLVAFLTFALAACSQSGQEGGGSPSPARSGGMTGSGTGGGSGRAGSGGAAGAPGTGGAATTPGTGGAGTGGGSGASEPGTGGRGAGGSGGGSATGGRGGSGASGGSTGTGGMAGPVDAAPEGAAPPPGDAGAGGNFSFFYTSLAAMRKLSGSNDGFGGDLRFGMATGLEGADKICQTIAAGVGAGHKTWRAFLSAVSGPGGQPVHAIDRIGDGPWYSRTGRLVAMNKAGLIAGDRPMGDAMTVADLPDEDGAGTRRLGDTHDVITGSDNKGRLASMNPASTCMDWTSKTGGRGVGAGHAWPASSGRNWIDAHAVPGCAAGVNTTFTPNNLSIGGYGGWGGFYCFALSP